MIEVYLTDKNYSNFAEISQWAQENCTSYMGVDVQDISDFSYVSDEIAIYKFDNSADAAMFTLKWKTNDN